MLRLPARYHRCSALDVNCQNVISFDSQHEKNAEAFVAATKEIGLEVNAHKTKYRTNPQCENW